MIYADATYYSDSYGGELEAGELDFKQASRHIDTLTYNHIGSLDALTPFQKRVVQESTCMLAEFEHENADLLGNVLQSYSINGTSLSFGGAAAMVLNGVCLRKDIYAYLAQSGLCCRGL